MDPALFRERELFKKRALNTPVIESKKQEKDIKKDEPSKKNEQPKKKPKPSSLISTGPKLDMVNYKPMAGTQYKFGVLAKIVKHMKARHQEGDDHPLTLDEILDETNQLDVGSKVKQWLQTEALVKNPKIEITSDNRFAFKPMYKIKDKKSLLRLLKQHDLKGLGGILLEDVQESLPHCDKHLKSLQNEILFIMRPIDKKKILFYNDKTAQFPVDEEFQKLWRGVAVDAMDDQKIDEYLEKQGIRSMQDHGLKKPAPIKRKKPVNRRKQFKKPRDNEHLADVLETYDD
ncbi:transcription initiation factor IIE subunit beta [Pseudomyrmex gracilis]|uniref:transcription initiation factor IIE subunit beta n=1 Tax=Pseudomyrmex gracilis TaxID=219809 RepID=UPI00099581AF|nr:transcription initiation factor IIE subunit beta [Pseudomyrmex gracilis]XP_020297052.1 transcription initiation factor IIE subunit beta [Pseudomyrmex gracilis]